MRRMVTNKEIEKLGGTKLYKHTMTIKYLEPYGEDPYDAEIIAICWGKTSLANQYWYYINDYSLSATINGDYIADTKIVAIYHEQDEDGIIYYDQYGNETKIVTDINNRKILTDTVTEL